MRTVQPRTDRGRAVRMSRCATIGIAIVLAAAPAMAARKAGPPSEDRIPALASALEGYLQERGEVVAPDGIAVSLVDTAASLLDRRRIERCLETISAADAWPEAWLVVQVADQGFDVVLPIRLDPAGELQDPDPVFAAARREWTVDALRDAIREATGLKARGRTWNLVVQGFRTRIENRYVYEPPTERRGLLALLPEGTLLREARRVELPDGRVYTLAVVLEDAEFVPSACNDCESRTVGHADSGRMALVLTDETGVRDRVDLTELLVAPDGRPLLPRFRCEERDTTPEERERPITERFADRRLVDVVELRDLDGDGNELELELLSGVEDCRPRTVRFAVVPSAAPRLYIVPP